METVMTARAAQPPRNDVSVTGASMPLPIRG